jgi:hypothetical protein
MGLKFLDLGLGEIVEKVDKISELDVCRWS